MPLNTVLCRQVDFQADWYHYWRQQIAAAAPELDSANLASWGVVWRGMLDPKTLHRKLWEWCAISQALAERSLLAPGKRGIGFAVGTEPLASLFAARGADIVASDYGAATNAAGWAQTGQLADSLATIHWPGFLSFAVFQQRVRYQDINMADLSHLPDQAFDFGWSSCAFEHLGSLEAGIQFVVQSMACLKPGGVAVHTTEFNVSSNTHTLDVGPNVIYRRQDIEALDCRLRQIGCALEPMDFDPGSQEHDLAFDSPPYYSLGRQHVKLQLGGYVTTSALLIIRKFA